MYKTLVMQRDDRTAILVMVPGGREVDLKRLSRSMDSRSVHMASKADAERLTGLQTGGIGALALLDRRFPVFIDRQALVHDRIFVNGGRRGLNLVIGVADLIAVTGATPVDTGDAVSD